MIDSLKEQTRQDLIEFFDSQGGHTRVAEKIGLTAQTLRNIKIGRNDVTLAILMGIGQAYPDNEQARMLLARAVGLSAPPAITSNDEPPTTPTGGASAQPLVPDVIALEKRVAVLEAENALLKQENKRVWKMALPKEVEEELNFLKSGSRPTAFEVMANANERTRIGYEYAKHLKSVDDKVTELVNQALVIPIDSLDNVKPLYPQPVEKQAS